MIKLNLGGGAQRISGFLNVDLISREGFTDIVDDICTLNSLEGKEVQSIVAEHCLEHLSFKDAEAALSRWFNLLIPGGSIEIEVPDMLETCREFVESEGDISQLGSKLEKYPTLLSLVSRKNFGIYSDWGRMRNIYGAQDTEGQFHKSGWWESRLINALCSVGFRIVWIRRSVLLSLSQFSYHAREEPVLRVKALK